MKQEINAGDQAVIVVLRDAATGATVSETPILAHRSMTFDIDDNLTIEGVEWDGSTASLYERRRAIDEAREAVA